MLLSLCGMKVHAYDFEKDGIYYNITSEGSTVEVTYGSLRDQSDIYFGDVTIPSTVSYEGTTYQVTGISGSAFLESGVTSVTIPNSVTHIDNNSFKKCI